MLPFQPLRSSGFLFGNVAAIMDNILALCVLGLTIKGSLVAAVNFFDQDFFSLVKGVDGRVALPVGINRPGNQTEQDPDERKSGSRCGR